MSKLTGRQIVLLVVCGFALITAAVSIYGLMRGPGGTNAKRPEDRSVRIEVRSQSVDPAITPHERSLPHTTDPIVYARAVAASLFEWDTSSGLLPTDYTAKVLADADPSGEETPGLLDDVATYLPTVEQWLDLGAMEVAQSLEIQDAYVPDSWAAAVDQPHGQLRPGTTAVTITGTRHRVGEWNGEVEESSYPVAFTVFVACQPSFERCRVLRLSQLDNPMR
ncbi:hypothetical protein GCM10023350_48860 [Nocardioides endophyticus]|uniref:Uncharacterized protein n=1 Tax=Nocardioides endophyticus TaxID=1353775 RepID=A0ABP8ZI87_9ACTN